jgi:hypothetical protein
MNYLYLIQKKEDKNTDIYKIGLLKYNNRINQSHDIILLLKNINKCININDLTKVLEANFKVVDTNSKYWKGDKTRLIYIISRFYKDRMQYFNTINDQKNEMIRIICLSKYLKDTEKYEQLIKLSNQKLNIRNIIFDSNIEQIEKYNKINNIISINSEILQPSTVPANTINTINTINLSEDDLNTLVTTSINSYGSENINNWDEKYIIELIKYNTTINIIDKFINLIHFNTEYPANNNIKFDNTNIDTNIKIYKNNKWLEASNKLYIFNKILNDAIKELYLLIHKVVLKNSLHDELYSKGLIILNNLCMLKKLAYSS